MWQCKCNPYKGWLLLLMVLGNLVVIKFNVPDTNYLSARLATAHSLIRLSTFRWFSFLTLPATTKQFQKLCGVCCSFCSDSPLRVGGFCWCWSVGWLGDGGDGGGAGWPRSLPPSDVIVLLCLPSFPNNTLEESNLDDFHQCCSIWHSSKLFFYFVGPPKQADRHAMGLKA